MMERHTHRRHLPLLLLVALTCSAAPPPPPPGACPGGSTPLASFQLLATTTADQQPSLLPLRSLTRLEGGARILFRPEQLYSPRPTGTLGSSDADGDNDLTGEAQVALISIPTTPSGVLGILEAQKASQPAEWVIPSRAAAIALVYGPQGLSLPKLAELMRRDPQLVTQLAAYAEKSAQTELLMETITAWEHGGGGAGAGGQGLEAALQGFASRSGVVFPAFNRNATTDQQALSLMRALHPALSSIDPLAPNPAQRMQQSASLAASVAGLFFGNTVGLASAGGAMFLNLRSLFFPGSEFRSALAQPIPNSASSSAAELSILCTKREPSRSRTRPIYLWATRIQGMPPPKLSGLPYRLNLAPNSSTQALLPITGANLASVRNWSTQPPLNLEFLPAQSALSITIPPNARKGDQFELRLEVEDSPVPIVLPAAIQILGPRPVIKSVQTSSPQEFSVPLAEGELAANSFAALSIRTAHTIPTTSPEPLPTLHIECLDPALTLRKLTIRPGEQLAAARLRPVGAAAWFLSFEPGSVGQPPCALTARLETSDGLSDPHPVGRLVRLPRIDKFSLSPELIAASTYAGWLEGEELESIEKTGWDRNQGITVTDPPIPVANHANRQRLKIAMPWPPPAPRAALYVWLRGETQGRPSAARY